MKKTVYLIRHAESTHNEFAFSHPKEKVDPCLFDAPLSSKGLEQIKISKPTIDAIDDIELIVCSPLSRALKTCLFLFGDRKIPTLVHPLCRELVDTACDLGRHVNVLEKEFAGAPIDFSLLPQDVWFYTPPTITFENYQSIWKEKPWKEPTEILEIRIDHFKQWILERKENKIAVVAHSNFFKFWIGPPKLPNCGVHKLEF